MIPTWDSRGVKRSLLGEIAFRGRVGHSCFSGAFKMTMIRDTGWGASASSSASFASRSLTLSRSVPPPFYPTSLNPRLRRLLVLLNHYNRLRHWTESKHSCTDERVRARTLIRLSRTTFVPSGMTWAPPRFNVQRENCPLSCESIKIIIRTSACTRECLVGVNASSLRSRN